MNATYTQPECVFTFVRSATYNRFGAGAANLLIDQVRWGVSTASWIAVC